MKNMVLLIDANVVLDYLLNREPHFADTYKIINYCKSEAVEGFIAFHSMSVIWYVLRNKPREARRAALMDICEILVVYCKLQMQKEILFMIRNRMRYKFIKKMLPEQ